MKGSSALYSRLDAFMPPRLESNVSVNMVFMRKDKNECARMKTGQDWLP